MPAKAGIQCRKASTFAFQLTLDPSFRPNPYPGPLDTGGDRRQRSQRRGVSEGREQEELKNQQEATEKTEKVFSVSCNSSSVPSVASCSISYYGSGQRPGCGIRKIRGQCANSGLAFSSGLGVQQWDLWVRLGAFAGVTEFHLTFGQSLSAGRRAKKNWIAE